MAAPRLSIRRIRPALIAHNCEDEERRSSISPRLIMNSINLRPSVIVEIARWWQQCLSTAEQESETLMSTDISEVKVMFQCSTEEAIRGICTGEQLHWGGNR